MFKEYKLTEKFNELLEETKIDIDDLDDWFSRSDFTDEGGVTPLQFNIKRFVEEFKKEGVFYDSVVQLGMLYTMIYNDTDIMGENSTLPIFVRDLDKEEDSIIFKGTYSEWKEMEMNEDYFEKNIYIERNYWIR